MLLLIAIGIQDAKEKRISNRWIVLLLVTAFIHRWTAGSWNWIDMLLGGIGVSTFLVVVVFLKPGAFGGGDIKLMVASGILLGAEKNFYAFAIGIMLAAVYCIMGILRKRINRKATIPFGPFLCIGIACCLFC